MGGCAVAPRLFQSGETIDEAMNNVREAIEPYAGIEGRGAGNSKEEDLVIGRVEVRAA